MQPQQPPPYQPFQPQGGQWQQAHTMPVGAPQRPAYMQQQQPMMVAPPPPPKKKSVVWRVLGGIVAGVVAFLVVGWLLASGPEPAAAPEQAVQAVSGIPRPDGQQTEELLRGLGQVADGLEHTRSIDRARNVCVDLLAGGDRGEIVERARQRFDGRVVVDAGMAEEIVKLVEQGGWCRATA